MSEEDKQRLKEYQKSYREAKNIFHRCKKKTIVLSKKYSKLLSQRYCLLVLLSIL